jgi:hypothetical protein
MPRSPLPTMHRLPEQRSIKAALRGRRPGRTEAKPHSQLHGRAAYGRAGSLVQRRVGGAGGQSPRSAANGARAAGNLALPVRFRCRRPFPRPSTQPNRSFNRSANGMAPGPRSAVCISCAARARRHTVVARLTLR